MSAVSLNQAVSEERPTKQPLSAGTWPTMAFSPRSDEGETDCAARLAFQRRLSGCLYYSSIRFQSVRICLQFELVFDVLKSWEKACFFKKIVRCNNSLI
jgi:hypothetical protein